MNVVAQASPGSRVPMVGRESGSAPTGDYTTSPMYDNDTRANQPTDTEDQQDEHDQPPEWGHIR